MSQTDTYTRHSYNTPTEYVTNCTQQNTKIMAVYFKTDDKVTVVSKPSDKYMFGTEEMVNK